jgi:hypothetical protein
VLGALQLQTASNLLPVDPLLVGVPEPDQRSVLEMTHDQHQADRQSIGQRDLVMVLGAAPSIAAGECIQASGRWNHPRAWFAVSCHFIAGDRADLR